MIPGTLRDGKAILGDAGDDLDGVEMMVLCIHIPHILCVSCYATDVYITIYIYIHTYIDTDRQIDRQTDRQIDR